MSNEKFQGVDLQVARTPEENADWVVPTYSMLLVESHICVW